MSRITFFAGDDDSFQLVTTHDDHLPPVTTERRYELISPDLDPATYLRATIDVARALAAIETAHATIVASTDHDPSDTNDRASLPPRLRTLLDARDALDVAYATVATAAGVAV